VEGGQLTVGTAAELGGMSYVVTLFESDDNGAWIRLTSCYD